MQLMTLLRVPSRYIHLYGVYGRISPANAFGEQVQSFDFISARELYPFDSLPAQSVEYIIHRCIIRESLNGTQYAQYRYTIRTPECVSRIRIWLHDRRRMETASELRRRYLKRNSIGVQHHAKHPRRLLKPLNCRLPRTVKLHFFSFFPAPEYTFLSIVRRTAQVRASNVTGLDLAV